MVDCQWACPAHTPVPEYIRLIAEGRYSDAYMINWKSNVFPGILGRTCDRPCEPACRRGRVEDEPVAICRLKRVAADYKDDITARLPKPAAHKNGKRIALVGGGPASLTVARDLAPLGYQVVVFDGDPKAGGMIRTQIPKFRLPDSVIDEETGYILGLGVEFRGGKRIDSMKALLAEGWDAVFVGSGAPRGRDLDIPGRKEAAKNIHIGIDWLSSVSFGHVNKIGKRVIVLGGGNTAMDCCRSARRLGGEDVKVVVRSGFEEMKASPWEKEDARRGHPDRHLPRAEVIRLEDGQAHGMTFEKVKRRMRRQGPPKLVAGEPDQHFLRRRDPGDRPGERVPLDRARHRHRVRRARHANHRQEDFRVHAARRVLRRRRRLGPEEHHLGRGARARGGDLDPQPLPARPSPRRPRPAGWTSSPRRWACTSGATATTTPGQAREDEARRPRVAL